jgi:hypothetical protein
MRLKTGLLWTLAMVLVLGMVIGIAYGEIRAPSLCCRCPAWAVRFCATSTGPTKLISHNNHIPTSSNTKTTKGLAGYVDYPTQELVSGLLPLDDLGALASAAYNGSACIRPGMGLPGLNASAPISGSLVRKRGGGRMGFWQREQKKQGNRPK